MGSQNIQSADLINGQEDVEVGTEHDVFTKQSGEEECPP